MTDQRDEDERGEGRGQDEKVPAPGVAGQPSRSGRLLTGLPPPDAVPSSRSAPEAAPPPVGPPSPVPPRAFPGLIGFVVLTGAAMVLQFVVLGAVIAVTGARSLTDLGSGWVATMALLQSLGWPLVAVVAVAVRGMSFTDALSLRWHGRFDWAFMGLGAAAGLLMVFPAIWLKLLLTRFTGQESTILEHLLGLGFSVEAVVLICLAVLAAAPLGEEMLFRGLAFGGLRKRYGVWPAAVMVSAVFAGVHLQASAFLPIFFLSMMLCWLVHATGSLLPCVACHFAYNGIQVAGWLAVWWRGLPRPKGSAAEPQDVGFSLALFSCVLLGLCLWSVAALAKKRSRLARAPGPEPESGP